MTPMDHPPPIPYSSPNAPPATPAYAGMPTSPQEIQAQLAAAQIAGKKIRRLANVATIDAWTIALFAAPSFICGLTSGFSGVLLGAAMGVIAYFEFTGAAAVRRLDVTAPRRLAYNQLAFAATLILYALWSIYAARNGGGLVAALKQQAGGDADLAQSGVDLSGIYSMVVYGLYGTLIAVAVFAQGGTALYYLSREKILKQYVETTPPWVVDMQRQGTTL